jgi:hypothetical protein
VIASDTAVTVAGFHRSGQKGVVISRGDYSVSVAEGVHAEVRGLLRIGREARECKLRCASIVVAPNAAIIGGSTWCVRGAEVKIAGNEAGLATIIELRNELEVTGEFETLREDMAAHRKALKTLELHLGPYALDRRRVPLLKAGYRDRIQALVQKYDQVRGSLEKLEARAKSMHEGSTLVENARINVHERICPGVQFSASGVNIAFSEDRGGPVCFALSADGKSWEVREFESFDTEDL